jgi:hypothetical protein
MIDLSLINKQTELSVYDVLGRKLLQKKLQGETLHSLYLTFATDILIVRLSNPDGRICRKLMPLFIQ